MKAISVCNHVITAYNIILKALITKSREDVKQVMEQIPAQGMVVRSNLHRSGSFPTGLATLPE